MASAINNNNNNNTTLYENIIPFSSVRKQITLTLPTNNLKVLLVNDKLASQSTVALVVDGAGQLMDPSGVPGLAHLMEHMILSVNTAPPSNTNNGNTKGTSSAGSSGAAAGGGGGGFEEWLENNGGTSNAFTAYQQTCFHYNCPHGILSKSLEKFASLFISSNVISTCHNEQIISREVRRVDSELDLSSLNAQIEYVTKLFVNVEHPYSRFSRGDLNSLERIPRENDINVGEQLIRFFERYYLAKDAVLVVVTNQQSQGSNDLGLLKRWVVGPFSNILVSKSSTGMSSTATAASSSSPSPSSSTNNAASTIGGTTSSRPMTSENYYYPGRFLFGNRYKHLLLYRKDDTSSSLSSSTATIKGTTPNNNNNNEKLIMQWVLNEDYRSSRGSIDKTTNAIEIAFVLNQILGRRGPGSLYLFLRKRGWIQNSSSSLPPQFTVPVNLSGFQVLKITLSLTLEGFLNRSRIVTAVYDSIETLRNDPKNRFSSFDYSSIASTTKSTTATLAATATSQFILPREIMAQYATTAKLFGYTLTPRPPDAVEAAMDCVTYGIDRVTSGSWYRFPSTEDGLGGLGLARTRRAVSSALSRMSDPDNVLIIVTAGDYAISMTRQQQQSSQSSSSSTPSSQQSSQQQQQQQQQSSIVPAITSSKWKRERTSGALVYFEDLLQLRSRVEQTVLTNLISKEELLPPIYNPLVLTTLRPPRVMATNTNTNNNNNNKQSSTPNNVQEQQSLNRWRVLKLGSRKLPLPRSPPEVNCRCAFVLELLSPRPIRANAQQAANAELWKLTFDATATDLAELGAPGGLAYELSFNKYGLRISFLGLSQTLPSYARRLTQLLVRYQQQLLNGKQILPEAIISSAIADANRARDLSPARKRIIINTLRKATAYDAASEGIELLQSCTGAVCFSQGDLLPNETEDLFRDLQGILKDSIGIVEERELSEIPNVGDIVDTPMWKPRNAAPCYIAGVSLMSDACGRIRR